MTTTWPERTGLALHDGPTEPPGFLSAYPGYQATALLDRLRATEYSYLDAGSHVYLDYAGAGLGQLVADGRVHLIFLGRAWRPWSSEHAAQARQRGSVSRAVSGLPGV